MRKHYLFKDFSWFILLVVTIGCHQNPVIPKSAIPNTCQIYQVATVNEGVRDTTTYAYDAFGHLSGVSYRQWINGNLSKTSRQSFIYSADHFLVSRTEQTTTYSSGSQARDNKGYSYTYQDGLLQQILINNGLSGQTLGYIKYGYENGKLSAYTETNAQQQPVRNYTFDASGRLVQLTEAGTTVVLTNGKVTKRVFSNGITISYQFDGKGQLISDSTASASSQTKHTYTYDNKPYWNKTQLLFRGIPSPDLGDHTSVHNLLVHTIVQTQNGRLVQNQRFEYRRTYTKAGYTLGYARSDGVRQSISYANCL